jgi:L-lysine 2,3-aminomutase
VVELEYTPVLETGVFGHESSNLSKGTILMPYLDYEVQKAYQREWYKKNRKLVISRVRAHDFVGNVRRQVQELKLSNPCLDCHEYLHYSMMDFDHIGKKEASIARLLNKGYNFSRILKEIAKCELVCANCHRRRTWERIWRA